VKTLELDLNKVAMSLARDGFVVVPFTERQRAGNVRALADRVLLSDRADYPGSERDVGFLDVKIPTY